MTSLILTTVLGGICGTLAMTVFLFVPAWAGWGRVDVVRAVGAFVTHDREHALMPGMALHLCFGIFFAALYQFCFQFMGAPLNALTGAYAGFVHGVLVMLLVTVVVLEHHPLQWYRDRGPMTAVSQVLGHVLFGFVVGLFAQMWA